MTVYAKGALAALLAIPALIGCHTPKGESPAPELVVDGVVFHYHQREIRVGDPIRDWIAVLGPPSRASEKELLWTWDDLGMLVKGERVEFETLAGEVDLTLLAFDDPTMTDDDRLSAMQSDSELREDIGRDPDASWSARTLNPAVVGTLVAKYRDEYFNERQHPRPVFPGRVVLEHAVLENGWNDLADTVHHMHNLPKDYWYCRRRPLVDIAFDFLLPHGSGDIYREQEPDIVIDSPTRNLRIQFDRYRVPGGGECDWRFRELRFRRY